VRRPYSLCYGRTAENWDLLEENIRHLTWKDEDKLSNFNSNVYIASRTDGGEDE